MIYLNISAKDDPETAAAPGDYYTPDDQYYPAELPDDGPAGADDSQLGYYVDLDAAE